MGACRLNLAYEHFKEKPHLFHFVLNKKQPLQMGLSAEVIEEIRDNTLEPPEVQEVLERVDSPSVSSSP